jgi:hypothetical protein
MKTRRIIAFAISLTVHAVALVAAIVSSGRPPSVTRPAPRGRIATAFAAPRDDDSGPPGLKPIDPLDALTLRAAAASQEVVLPSFSMNIAKIADRAAVLFPFVTPGLSLHRFAIVNQEELRDTFIDPQPAAAPRSYAGRAQRPLALSNADLQAVIDRSWSRRDRWTPFQEIVRLANAHDPDAGRLPDLLHAYQRQNGLQPYVDASIRDPRLWAELGLAADHVEFIRFVSEFASAHPGTRAATELLFLLDQLAQANMDALVTLLDTDPPASLEWTRETNRDAYDLIVTLRAHYARQLQRKGLASPDAIAAHYAKVRLAILDGILRNTPHGYRASDARFLIGAIRWREGDRGDALRAWRGMTIDPADAYATSSRRILDAIAAETGGDRADADARETMRRIAVQVNAILRAEHGRWVMFSIDRLRQFGFHFDTF